MGDRLNNNKNLNDADDKDVVQPRHTPHLPELNFVRQN